MNAVVNVVAKNRTALLDRIFAAAVSVERHDRDSYYAGVSTTAAAARQALATGRHAKLYRHNNGRYRVQVHGCLWYEFKTQEVPK